MSDEHIYEYEKSFTRGLATALQGVRPMVDILERVRAAGGRVYVLGLGGSAGNASHMVNDLRKLCGMRAYAPTDNVSEFSAWCNDDGISRAFVEYLKNEKLSENDAVVILSVGGGQKETANERGVSTAIVEAIDYCESLREQDKSPTVISLIGRYYGYASRSDLVVYLGDKVYSSLLTPISEALQAAVWHAVVSHPRMQTRPTTW